MIFSPHKVRDLVLLSMAASTIGLISAYAANLSITSIMLAAVLILAHIPLFLAVQNQTRFGWAYLNWMQNLPSAKAGFLVCTSLLSSSLGILSWVFLFDPASLVREALIQLSPVISWGVVMAAVLVANLGAELNREEKRDGLLIGAVSFSIIGHLFLFWLSAQIFSFTIDDAYITFRYSKNLASGFGPTYNPGLPPVEGYTTFLWMILMTLPHFLGVSVATFSKIAGILLTCVTFLVISSLTTTLTRNFSLKARLFFGTFASYILAMLPITSVHAIAGMETPLFIFLISLMVFLVTVGILDKSRWLFWAPFVGLGIGMTRPEGNAISILLLACGWLLSPPNIRKRLTWYSIFLYILPGALYFLWRYLYYDLILPLPFYMKVLHGSGLFGGATEVANYLIYLMPSISVLLLIALIRLRKEYFSVLVPIVFLLVFYLFPVHAMGFNWRFIYPATPFVCVLVALGGITVFDLMSSHIQFNKVWVPFLLLGFLLIGIGNPTNLNNMIRQQNFYGAGISKYKSFGTIISEYNDKHEMTLAMGDAGTVPYYSNWRVIDLFGLNSREVAFGTLPVETLVFEQQPVDLILLSGGPSPNRISDEHRGAQNLYNQAIQRGMVNVGTFPFGRVNYIWVLGYPDTGLASYLQEQVDFIK